MRSCWTVLLVLLALYSNTVAAQSRQPAVTIAVDVTENTGGLFASGFSAALRGLDDVAVVSLAESPQYVLRVVVLCQPSDNDCQHAESYSLAIEFEEPLTRVALALAAVGSDTSFSMASADSMFADLPSDEGRMIELDAALWGRNTYERGIRELVAKLDHGCFERSRLINRMSSAILAKDRATAQAINKEIEDGHWAC